MKAIILAAGYATRLYPLTQNFPKPLLKVGEKPMIEWIIEKIEKIKEIDKYFIITNHKFSSHFYAWHKNFDNRKKIKIIDDGSTTEENRLGAIGDINFVIKTCKLDEDILIVGGDNLFQFNLPEIYDYFQKKGNTIVLKDLQDISLVSKYSQVTLDKNDQIIDFCEKPQKPETSLIATCMYFLKKEIIVLFDKYLNENTNPDAPGYFIQWLYKNTHLHGFVVYDSWFDIGDINSYNEANQLYTKLDTEIQPGRIPNQY